MLEKLESRHLFAATAGEGGDLMYFHGDAANETVYVRRFITHNTNGEKGVAIGIFYKQFPQNKYWSSMAQPIGQVVRIEIDGGGGNDHLIVEPGVPGVLITGGDGNDTLIGGNGNDTILGGAGDDAINGRGGDDRIAGEDGNDSIKGMAGFDVIDGGAGNDVLVGGDNADRLYGGDGSDLLVGEAGADTLYGGGDYSPDTLYGGGGTDHFFRQHNEGGHSLSTYFLDARGYEMPIGIV